MDWPACGRSVEPAHARCGSCGAPLPAAQDGAGPAGGRPLARFGPMGFGVTFSRPGLFVFTYQNCTEIVATAEGLHGTRKLPRFVFARHGKEAGRIVFDIPWGDVTDVRRADYLLSAALWIRYRAGGEVKGVGVEAGPFWRHRIRELEAIARRCRPDAFDEPGLAERRPSKGSVAPWVEGSSTGGGGRFNELADGSRSPRWPRPPCRSGPAAAVRALRPRAWPGLSRAASSRRGTR